MSPPNSDYYHTIDAFTGAKHCYISRCLSSMENPPITEDYKLSRKFCKHLRSLPVPFKSDVSQTTYVRTYSRIKDDGTNEEWADTVIRNINGTISAYLSHMKRARLAPMRNIDDYAKSMATAQFKRQWMPPGRGLWSMGTDYVNKRGNAALNNCYAVSTENNLVLSLSWAKDMLMCGGGVGFDTNWKGSMVKPNKDNNFVFAVPDSREGWVAASELLLRAYIPVDGVITNKFPIFDYSLVRVYGEKIYGYGGTSSGPEPLRILMARIEAFADSYIRYTEIKHLLEEGKIDEYKVELTNLYIDQINTLNSKNAYWLQKAPQYDEEGKLIPVDIEAEAKARKDTYDYTINAVKFSVDKYYEIKAYEECRFVTDVMNCIAACIVAGNVRRSSLIAISDVHDYLKAMIFINLKNYEKNPERMMWGWCSNNTVRLRTNEEFEKWIKPVSELIKINGEPGILNLINVGKYGRVGDTSRRQDDATLVNPCGEVCLCSFEPCTLSIVVPYNCRDESGEISLDVILKAAEYATFYATVVTTIPHHWPESNAIIAKNRRIGVSFSGVTNIYYTLGLSTLITISRRMYHKIVDTNEKLAEQFGIPAAIRVTCIKPEGTTSLIAEVNSGIHFAKEEYCIRRICMGNDCILLPYIAKAGYKTEPSKYTPNTTVVEFLMYNGSGKPAAKVPMLKQFNLLTSMAKHYADNAISNTVTFSTVKDDEGASEADEVEDGLGFNVSLLKSCSLLPQGTKYYAQLPYEKITKEQYIDLSSKLIPIEWSQVYKHMKSDGVEPKFCTNDSCTL